MGNLTEEDLIETYTLFRRNNGSVRQTAKDLKLGRNTVRKRLDKAAELLGVNWKEPLMDGSVSGFEHDERPLPPEGEANVYIISCAQNNTHVHTEFFENLIAYADHVGAELLISRYSYNKTAYGRWKPEENKPGVGPVGEDFEELFFDAAIDPYICDDRLKLAPTLYFCGELNIIPTAVRPLSGFESYPGHGASAIVPHTTIAMETIAALENHKVKFNYSTGTVTKKNYIQKKAGLKAEHHHCFGALIVEVDHNGDWWVRQINGTDEGSFQDLDNIVINKKVSSGNRIEAVNWGDIHQKVIDPVVEETNWGKGGILDTFKPKYQFFHDTIDFYARNHHNRKDPHSMFEKYVEGNDSVKQELQEVADFLNDRSYREWCKSVVITSNHDNALTRWLKETDYRTDPTNAVFFLSCQLALYKAIKNRLPNFHLVETVLYSLGVNQNVEFLRDNESFMICGGEIECSMHGHLGINGARGTPLSFSKTGRKSNTGHTHTACIIHGAYVAGTSSELRLEYNTGLSSWSHSHILSYPNAKRSIITMRNGLYRPYCLLG